MRELLDDLACHAHATGSSALRDSEHGDLSIDVSVSRRAEVRKVARDGRLIHKVAMSTPAKEQSASASSLSRLLLAGGTGIVLRDILERRETHRNPILRASSQVGI